MNKLIVSLSPHVHSDDSVKKNMYGVLIALIPAFLVSLYFFGLGALIVTLTSVVACVFFEWAISKYLLKKETTTITDGSAIITGVLLAPVQMTSWPVVGQLTAYTDATTTATPLAVMKGVINGAPGFSLDQLPGAFDLLLGNNPGCIGEVSALALLLGLVYMLWKKIITWHIPVSILVTVFVFGSIMHMANPELYVDGLTQLLSGGLMLGAVFMATDYVTSPMNHKGMLIYGVCIGLLTVVIRLFGAYPEGMSFAILIMNAFTPLINTYVKPKRFGEVAKKK